VGGLLPLSGGISHTTLQFLSHTFRPASCLGLHFSTYADAIEKSGKEYVGVWTVPGRGRVILH